MMLQHTGVVKSSRLHVCAWTLALAISYAIYVNHVTAKSFIEPCAAADSCSSFVTYKLPSEKKVQDVALLFSVDTVALFGANNFDVSLPDLENLVFAANVTITVPISCSCINGIRRGNSTLYVVKSGDTLYGIASTTFGALVSYEQIRDANQISDPSTITVGQQLVIPFPCACHDLMFNNQKAVFLSYLVEAGDTVNQIAAKYSVTTPDFMALNNMNSSSNLLTGDVVEIPVHACTSSFRRSAADYGLFVASGGYVITADHCVQCSCRNNLQQVYCIPAPAALSGSCPSSACYGSNLTIGQLISTPSFESCSVTSCVYNGFKRKTIISSLQTTTQGSCPASPSPLPYQMFPSVVTLSPAYAPVNSLPSTPSAVPPTSGAHGQTSAVNLTVNASLTSMSLIIICVIDIKIYIMCLLKYAVGRSWLSQ